MGVNILGYRLYNQQINNPSFKTPLEVVQWMGAVQAQDFAGAKWALGLRLPGWTDHEIEQAFNSGEILRTHVLRPTWHFVSPQDIHWMLQLTAPHIEAASVYQFRRMGLDSKVFSRSNKIIVKAFADTDYQTRDELRTALSNAKIDTSEERFIHLLFKAELEGLICSGPRVGKQFTYALLSKRAPHTKVLSPEEALVELTRKYFKSHGPATVQDYAWWSGLSQKQAKTSIEMVTSEMVREKIGEQEFWSFSQSGVKAKRQSIHLLPAYDEYTVAYADRSPVLDPKYIQRSGNGIFKPVVIINGNVLGTWARTLKKSEVNVTVQTFTKSTDVEKKGIQAAINRYSKFLDLK
jgi:hypothetical protein